jgi:hypothetical protein
MRRLVVLLTLSLGLIAPLAVSVAEAAAASPRNTDCRSKRAKKAQDEPKKKDKGGKDGKDGKKPYGFEL